MVRLTPAHRRAEVIFAYTRTTPRSFHCVWPCMAAATVHMYVPALESSDSLRHMLSRPRLLALLCFRHPLLFVSYSLAHFPFIAPPI
eukprot:6169216-Pleurochrysis_carterae.AAC.1